MYCRTSAVLGVTQTVIDDVTAADVRQAEWRTPAAMRNREIRQGTNKWIQDATKTPEAVKACCRRESSAHTLLR